MSASSSFEQLGREVIQLEAEALQTLATRVDAQFAEACRLVLSCQGRVVVTGMGKSGHIGGKIAATLASTVWAPSRTAARVALERVARVRRSASVALPTTLDTREGAGSASPVAAAPRRARPEGALPT